MVPVCRFLMLLGAVAAMGPVFCSQGVKERAWRANWIAASDCMMQDWRGKDLPAPVFEKEFAVTNGLAGASLYVCGLGYFHCRLDGKEFSDIELSPAPTQYDRRWRYRRLALPGLTPGTHVLTVEVGDGLYRPATPDSWHFDKATWLDYPKLICEIEDAEGRLLLKTDRSWRVRHGPTVHTALRGGETYDARREVSSDWMLPRIVPGPGGVGEEETMPPCRVVAVHPMSRRDKTDVYDAGVDLAGVPRIVVRGKAGSKVTVACGETLTADGRGVRTDLACLVFNSPDFQRDVYILKGEGDETWRPRFTYHGFRYAAVAIEGEAELVRLEALEINTDFRRIGRIKTSNGILTAIERKAMQAVRSNYVGIPTDCPHREKNGWFSEARLQCEALAYTYDSALAELSFVETACDTQRPAGQLSCMAPVSGWGYCWAAGPTYESSPFLMAESVWRFTGEAAGLVTHYGNLVRNIAHHESLRNEDGLVVFGLGDWLAPTLDRHGVQTMPRRNGMSWCHPEATNAPYAFLQTAFYKRLLDLAAEVADLKGLDDESARWHERSEEVAQKLWKHYDGTGNSTVPALVLQFGICPDSERAAVAAHLAEIVRRNGCRVDYGTIGSGCVLRALFENGYEDLGYRMMVQEEYPGYGFIAKNDDLTTFPEQWGVSRTDAGGGVGSLNHGAFSDVVACLYRYLGGIRHVAHRPGRDFVEIRPCFPKGLADFSATHEGYVVSWRRNGAAIDVDVVVPDGKSADCFLPGEPCRPLASGNHRFKVSVVP